MKKLVHLILSLSIAAAIGWVGWNSWQTARYFQEHGRESRLKVGQLYNASRWAEPLPLKKIHTYTAVFGGKHEVLIETDQTLRENDEVFIRFLGRDLAPALAAYSVRPLVNTIRLRTKDDGSPVKIEDSDLFDRAVDVAMGPPAAGVYVRPRAVAEAAPDRAKPTVPFLIGGALESPAELIWKNSRAGEWALLGLAFLLFQSWFVYAWSLPWRAARSVAERKDFVHPSMRRIDADAPPPPSKKLTYIPKPEEEIVLPASAKITAPKPAPIPGATPPAATPTPDSASASLSSRETAPPMPLPSQTEPVLKLKRK